jgi:hypothetical protein
MLELLHLTFHCEIHQRAMKRNKDCKRIVEDKTLEDIAQAKHTGIRDEEQEN